MIHTSSTAYISGSDGKLVPLGAKQTPVKYFVTAPDIESIRELLRSEIDPAFSKSMPVLFITRQTPHAFAVPVCEQPIDYQI